MDQKQLSQLDPKLKAVYDRVMGIATAPAPNPPSTQQPHFQQPPAPPVQQQAPQTEPFGVQQSPIPALPQTSSPLPRPSFVVEEVPHPSPAQLVPPVPPTFTQSITSSTPSHSDQGQTFFSQDAQTIPTLRSQQPPPPMQPMQSAMPVTSYAPQAVVPAKNSHAFMVLFIILGIIFFILYGVFWVQLFNIGIPALTSS